MESYSLQAVLSVSDQGFTNKMNGAVKAVDNLENGGQKATASIMDIASGIGVFKALTVVTNVLSSSLDGAISRFDTLNQYPKVMQQIGFSAEDTDASINRLSEGIDGLPTSLDGIASSTQNIAVLTRDLDKATETSIALNDAFLASGSATADAERGLAQYVQMLSKGEVDLESWRSLQETMGPALYEVAAAFGYAGSSAQNDLYAALKDGVITFDQFNDKLIELDGGVNGFAERARTASAGVATSFQNLQTSVVRGLENVIRAADSSLSEAGLPNFQQGLELAKTKVNETFAIATAATDKFVKIVAPGIKLVTNNLDVLVPVLGTATAGFISFKAAMAIQEKATSFKAAMANAVDTLNALKNSTQLAAQAAQKQEKAVLAAAIAEEKSAEAKQLEKVATEAQREAKNLSTKATNAQKKANEAAEKVERLKIQATKDQAAADRAAKRVQESKTTSTKLQEKAELAAAKAEESRIAVTEMETKATKLQTNADTLNVAATKATAQADKKAAAASVAKADADGLNALATSAETEAEVANAAAQNSSTAAAQISNIAIAAKTALLAILSGQYGVATAATKAFGAAIKANPIGAAIMAITALVAVIVAVTKAVQKYCEKHETLSYRQKESKKATKELTESLEESKDAYEDNCKEVKNSAGSIVLLAKKTVDLANKTGRSAADTELLKSNIEQLNSSVEGLNLAYDEQTGKLNMADDAMLSLVEAYKKQAEAEVYAERYKEILEEQLAVEEQLAESENLLKEVQDKYNVSMQNAGTTSMAYVAQLSNQQKSVKELEDQLDYLALQEQEVTDKIAQCKTEQVEATQSAADAQIASNEAMKINLENLSDAQEATLDRIVEAYETMTGSLSSLNDKIEEDNELTWSKVQENQADTIAKTQEFADLYKQAIDAGISESYLNAIGATGPEALPLLRGMMESGVDEVLKSQAEWEEAYDTISSSFVDSMNLSDEDKATLRSYISGEAGVLGTLQSALEAADFTSIGSGVVDGISDEIENSPKPGFASQKMSNSIIENAKDTLQVHSPSQVFRGIGGYVIDGFVLGIEGKEGSLNSSMQKIMNSAGKTASTALNNSLNGMSLTSTSAFMKISTAAKAGMQKTSSEIASGMQKGNTSMRSGMSTMNSTVSSRMQTIQNLMSTGMQRLVQAISAGMELAKAKMDRGSNSMVNVVKKLDDEFYDSGYYAALGLAKGIKSGSGQAIEAARKLADSVSATINAALKIHSPSQVTRESGGYTAEGMALGMLDKLRMVQRASDKIAMAAVPTGEISRLATSAGEYVVNTSQTYVGDVNATYSFVIPVMIDGREAARATATYTQEELAKREKLNKYMKGYR